jgi:hypothetical protein
VKRLRTLAVATAGFSLLGVAVANAAGAPEIDKANATMRLSPLPAFSVKECPGEDGGAYLTYRGGWTGAQTDTTPGSTDYNLTGKLTVKKVTWTINEQTQRGVLTGTAALSTPTAAGTTEVVYSGKLTVITQGVPSTGAVVPGRGWLSAATRTSGVADGGTLLANIELKVDGSFGANGEFGDANPTFGTPNFSVATTNGVC